MNSALTALLDGVTRCQLLVCSLICIYCSSQTMPQDDIIDTSSEMSAYTFKVYETCDILNGQPCFPCQQFIQLKSPIIGTQDTPALDSLLILQRKLRTEINHQHSPLPPELIARMFELFSEPEVNKHDSWDLWPLQSYLHSPLVLGAICRAWRDIAWSLASLWTSINISIGHNRNSSGYIDLVQQWLSRSGEHPLNLSTRFVEDIDTPFHQLISTINQHSYHWRNLYIFCTLGQQLRFICGDPQRGAPMLHSLCLERTPGPFRLSSTLSILEISGAHPSRVKLVRLPLSLVKSYWQDIKDACFVGDPFRSNHSAHLIQLPQLHTYALQDLSFSLAWIPHNAPPIEYHGIRQLSLGKFEDTAGRFPNKFSFPSVSHLHLFEIQNKTFISSIVPFITKSSMPLTFLRVDNVHCPSNQLLEILQRLPSLLELHISYSKPMSSFPTPPPPNKRQISQRPTLSLSYDTWTLSWDLPFWELILQMFLVPTWRESGGKHDNEDYEFVFRHNRPLKLLSIQSGIANAQWKSSPEVCTDRDIALQLHKLSKSGVDLQLYDNGADLLEKSMHLHEIVD